MVEQQLLQRVEHIRLHRLILVMCILGEKSEQLVQMNEVVRQENVVVKTLPQDRSIDGAHPFARITRGKQQQLGRLGKQQIQNSYPFFLEHVRVDAIADIVVQVVLEEEGEFQLLLCVTPHSLNHVRIQLPQVLHKQVQEVTVVDHPDEQLSLLVLFHNESNTNFTSFSK